MKLGLVIYGSLATLSGGYLYDRLLVEYLRACGDTVDVISLPWHNYAAHLADNLRFRLPSGLDLLIEDELNHPSLLAANARRHPYPVISLVHHLRSSERRPAWLNAFYRWVESHYLRSVDGFIFNSRTTRDVVHALTGDEKPNVIGYPPTDRFGTGLPPDLIRARAADSPPLRVLFVGSLIPRKGLHTLLQAVNQAGSQELSLDIVGSLTADPDYAARMRAIAASLQIASVTFQGPLDHGDLIDHLRKAHVLAVPSSYEGYGIAYLEGMAFGLPAVGTTAGAAGEIITDGLDGFLIRPDDAQGLGARLSALAHDRALLEQMSFNALERYRRQPAWPETAARIRQFLISASSG
jgi:glycosyltransferase involved in cell wall biosynthesis